MSMPADGIQGIPNNYDHISDMHNVLLGVLAMTTTITAAWWQGRNKRGRRTAASFNESIVELDYLPGNHSEAIRRRCPDQSATSDRSTATTGASNYQVSDFVIDSVGGDEGGPNTTQDAIEHNTTDLEQMEGGVHHPMVVQAIEGSVQEIETRAAQCEP
ncbi:hypothetical protein LTR15_008495 [Elasticomyces elasticus]|nr:hypothetical protein LTR15_008495 [Elasticomyces elasticus]